MQDIRRAFLSLLGCTLTVGVGCSPDNEPQPSAQDCVMSDWSEWSECSDTCDSGTQTRTRAVVTPSSDGGLACGALVEEQTCNEDPCLRLNHLQSVGSHNSYKIQPSEGLYTAIELVYSLYCFDTEDPPNLLPECESIPSPEGLVYTHVPLAEQFGTQGIRQIELDVWVDREGGKFAEPFGPPTAQNVLGLPVGPDFDPEGFMEEPGIKVFHTQDIDFRTHCHTWRQCLDLVYDWSIENPLHLPILILVELKQDTIDLPPDVGGALGIAFAEPTQWEDQDLRELQNDIRAAFHDTQLILPADVRGDFDTLYEAISTRGWPRVEDVRGKVFFALDNEGSVMDVYRNEVYPDLRDRILFTSSPLGEPDAAFRKENNPFADIETIVSQGYIVRSRADADTVQSRTNDTSQRDRALASGAHYVSTDYREPNTDFSDYQVTLPGEAVARCNPQTAPANCVSAEISP